MSRGAINELSSVCEGASYDEVYQIGQEPEEGHSWSLEGETSACSPNKDGENYIGKEDEEEIDEGEVNGVGEVDSEGEVEDDGVKEHTHPFILPQMWNVNDFLPRMTSNIFKNLRDRFQIPNHIPIYLPRKFEKCYTGETVDTSMYDTTLVAGLRLPLTALHR